MARTATNVRGALAAGFTILAIRLYEQESRAAARSDRAILAAIGLGAVAALVISGQRPKCDKQPGGDVQ